MKDKIETVTEDMRIEEVASLFITSKVRFIPITNLAGDLVGIVTQQAVFKQYQKMFGHKHNSLVIYTYDYRGVAAKIMETIAKAGGDIRNMMMFHTEVMDLVEIFMRIDSKDFDKVLKALEKQKFDVRDVKYAEQQTK
jgi:acetoin utilization protein AcuB